MAQTFGDKGNKIDNTDQLQPPAELTQIDPDPYGEKADAEAVARLGRNSEVKAGLEAAEADGFSEAELVKVAEVAEGDDDIEKPEIITDATPGNAVALVKRWNIDTDSGEVWGYDFLEFEGDKLGIRLPTRQALAAFSLASSKYVAIGVKNDLTGLFIARHLSPESYGRVFSRLMDPDDAAYTVETVGALFNAIVTAAIESDTDD